MTFVFIGYVKGEFGMEAYSLLLSFFVMAGTFALLMVLVLIALLVKHKSAGKSKALSCLRNFTLCFFCLILLYCFTSYKGIYVDAFQRGTFGRVIEFSLFIMLDYFWFVFIRTNLMGTDRMRPFFDKAVNVILAVFLIFSDFNCIVFIDADYYVAEPGARVFVIAVEIMCCLTSGVINIVYISDVVKAAVEKSSILFIVIISLLTFINGVLSSVFTIRLAAGKMVYEVESFYYDPTSMIMILIMLSVLVYLFRHDFSPIYFMESAAEELTDEETLELLAQECGLSKREREISLLIFRGDSYEDIAEQLFISKLTVKKHAHNLYEKLQVSNRMDLINLVRARKIQERENTP